jgi:site-specific DNA-methyltransferase (adenine-specific)
MSHLLVQADARRIPLPDKSVDLCFGSPPYCDARTYGINAQRNAHEWVAWMLDCTTEALRVSRGAVLWVVGGVTRDRTYWPACEGLAWEWFKRGGSGYRPCYWHRVGIPGSGGDQWFRADVEYILCFKRPGKLPWSDNLANSRRPNSKPKLIEASEIALRKRTKRLKTTGPRGDVDEQVYTPPVKANPGNLIKINVGGGHLGSDMAHENEAPFPETLAEWFIASLCPPGGTALDPFSGSGTTVAVAERLGRQGIGLDIRASQAELSKRRVERPHKPTQPMAKRAEPEEAFALKGLS